jgi:hypothetical protein
MNRGESISDNLKVIQALINAGADLNYRTDKGKSALNYGTVLPGFVARDCSDFFVKAQWDCRNIRSIFYIL